MDAVGEALLQHYNVGIRNPWFEIGESEQETYNRRQLPWAGNSYRVDANTGQVSGPNTDQLPDTFTDSDPDVNPWVKMAQEAGDILEGERYENLEALSAQGLSRMASALRKDEAHQSVTVTTADGGSKEVSRYAPPAER